MGMELRTSVFLVLFALTALTCGKVQSYNFRDLVVQITPTSHDQLRFLKGLVTSNDIDFWVQPTRVGIPCDLHLRKIQIAKMMTLFNKMSLKFEVKVADLQSLIDGEKLSRNHFSSSDPLLSYVSQAEIADWLSSTSTRCGRRCTLMHFGTSLEGRDMKLIKIVGDPNSAGGKPAVFIDGGIHAREWISPVFVNNMIQKLIDHYGVDSDVTSMVDTYDWYILPLLNPDGYNYSQENERMWRKNRATISPSSGCRGVDLNRNFGFQWGGVGVSSDPCSDIYAGPSAFSEPESRALQSFLTGLSNLRVYLTVHSYGQYILHPWGYTTDNAPSHDNLNDVGMVGAAALRASGGGSWTVGSSANVLYPNSGTSRDWAYGGIGATYSYTLELPPRTSWEGGFILPESEIPRVVSTVWPGIKSMIQRIINKENEDRLESQLRSLLEKDSFAKKSKKEWKPEYF